MRIADRVCIGVGTVVEAATIDNGFGIGKNCVMRVRLRWLPFFRVGLVLSPNFQCPVLATPPKVRWIPHAGFRLALSVGAKGREVCITPLRYGVSSHPVRHQGRDPEGGT